jgi:UDP-glucose 4-epimerase
MTRRALVLGGQGFIGSHACRMLAGQGFVVSGIGHGTWAADELARWGIADWTAGDIDLAALRRVPDSAAIDVVVHCAGGGAVARSYAAPLDDYERSVASTAALLEFVRADLGGRPRVVMASSAAVYGDQGEVDLSESATRSPVSPYGFHKVAAENLCDSWSRFFGVRVSVVRLFSVYGEGLRKQLLWDAVNKLSRGDRRFFGTGHELRDWVHVEDAARLLCLAATADGQDNIEIYNGGHAHHATSDVLGELARLLGSSDAPVFTGETHVGNPRRLTANSRHAHRQLGWRPEIGLHEGLRRYVDWFRGQPEAAA